MRLKAILIVASAASLICTSLTQATLIASDSFPIGTDPATTYTAATAIQNQIPAAFGFSALGWTSGIGTSQFQPNTGGLSDPSLTGSGGEVDWLGASTAANRSIARNLTTSQGSNTFIYYTSQLLKRNADSSTTPTATSFVGLGYGNSVFPSSGTTAGFGTGFFIGFDQQSATDQGSLAIRTRTGAEQADGDVILVNGDTAAGGSSTAGTQYLVVTKAETNYTGGSLDRITIWVNPTNTSSEAAMTASSLYTTVLSSTYALGGTNADLARLNLVGSGAFAPGVVFDETRLGTALTDVVSAPEPASLAMLSLIGMMTTRRRRTA